MDEWVKKMWYIDTMEFSSHEKEGHSTIFDNLDGPWAHYTKWKKWDRMTSTLGYHLHGESKKKKKKKKTKLIKTE